MSELFYSRCGCKDPENFMTDGFKVTCKVHWMDWNIKETAIQELTQQLTEARAVIEKYASTNIYQSSQDIYGVTEEVSGYARSFLQKYPQEKE